MGCAYCGGPLSRVENPRQEASLPPGSNGREVWRCIVCGADQCVAPRQPAIPLPDKLKVVSTAKVQAS